MKRHIGHKLMSRFIDILNDLNFHRAIVKKIAKNMKVERFNIDNDLSDAGTLWRSNTGYRIKCNILDKHFNLSIASLNERDRSLVEKSLNYDPSDYFIVNFIEENLKNPDSIYPDYVIVKGFHFYVNEGNNEYLMVPHSVDNAPGISYQNLICCWFGERNATEGYPFILSLGLTRLYYNDGIPHRKGSHLPAVHVSHGVIGWNDAVRREATQERENLACVSSIMHNDSNMDLGDGNIFFNSLQRNSKKPEMIEFVGYKEYWHNNKRNNIELGRVVPFCWDIKNDYSNIRTLVCNTDMVDFFHKFHSEIDIFNPELFTTTEMDVIFWSEFGYV